MKIDRHHLLECILWPNGDGTFRKIVNTEDRLRELGIYDDYKLTIPIECSAHATMHHEFKRGTKYSMEGINNPMYGISGDKHPMYGMTCEKNPNWKGDNVGSFGAYVRAKKLYKAGKLSEEEFQPYRDIWSKYMRERKQRRKNKLLSK